MSKILIPTRGPTDWRALLADPEKHWRHGFSAMAAACAWENADGAPPEIARVFARPVTVLLAIPEHKVPLPGGSRESQCDVFALLRLGEQTCALAVEAKVEEPFGPTIGDWMKNPSPGKQTRMAFISDVLGLRNPPPQLRYQLLHRTAAAVIEAQRFKTDEAAMLVQSFSPRHRWFDDFAAFAGALGGKAARDCPVKVDLPSGMPLTLGWAVGDLPAPAPP